MGGRESEKLEVNRYLTGTLRVCQPQNHTEGISDETMWKDLFSCTSELPRLNSVQNEEMRGVNPQFFYNLPRKAGVSNRHNNI